MTDSKKLDLLISEMQGMRTEIGSIKTEIGGIKTEIDHLGSNVNKLKTDIRDMKQIVSNIEIHLENVTDKNIRIIAEGHLDLSRKLDDALKAENEKELLLVRMNYLEDEMQRIKERLAPIA